jgi:hypothetical protein
MKIKELIKVLNAYNPELPVCFFESSRQEYCEIDDDESNSINRVWDDAHQEWILSLTEGDDTLYYRLLAGQK